VPRWNLVLLAVGLVVAIQLVPLSRTNPPVSAPLAAPPDVQAVLDRACRDCHTHETRWPWYAHVAPVSWFVVHDVNHGRKHLDFSRWGEYSEKKQRRKARAIWDEIDEGEMPLAQYLWLHPEAKLSDADKATLHAWTTSIAGDAPEAAAAPLAH
jgi:hypothetical protein